MDAESKGAPGKVKIWDGPTRLFHWAIVGLIVYLWWSERSDDIAHHKLAGYALIGLIVFRLYWGVFGSQTARFGDFLKGPGAIWRYLRGRGADSAGHNPLGALSVVVMLTLLVIECVLGLFAIDEDGLESGPLASMVDFDWAQRAAGWHALVFDALLAVIGLHIGAILLYALAGNNLVLPMITGRRVLAPGVARPAFASWWRVIVGAALAGAAFYVLWRLDR